MKSKMRSSILTFVLLTLTASLLFLGCPIVDPFSGSVTISGGATTLERLERASTPFTATPSGFDVGAALTYTWSVLDSTDADVTNAGSTTDEATFTPAAIDTAGTYTVKVVVSDGTNQTEDTVSLTVTTIAAETLINLTDNGNFGVYTETPAHADESWPDPVFIINRDTDLGNVQESITNVESTTSPEEGTKFIEATLSPDGIIYFGNGRPETPIVSGLGTWEIHFKAKADTDGVTLNVLADDATWATPLAEDKTVNSTWADYTVTGNSLSSLALLIFTNKDTVDRTIAIDDVYIAYDSRTPEFTKTLSGAPIAIEIDGTTEKISCTEANWGGGNYYSTAKVGTYTVDGSTSFSIQVSWDVVSGEETALILSPSAGSTSSTMVNPASFDGLMVNLQEWGAQVMKTSSAGPDWANANSQFAWTSGGASGFTGKDLTFTYSYDGTNWEVDATDGTNSGSVSLTDMTDASIFSTGAYLHVGVGGTGSLWTNPVTIKQINGSDIQ